MTFETHRIVGRDYTRDVWLLSASQKEHSSRLGIFLDAELYLKNVDAVPIIRRLMDENVIPQMTWLFVSHVNSAARHKDFTGNENYSRFIAEDAVAWARKRDESLATNGHLICGLSLSGLAATYITLQYPRIFPASLCQSGSFWWWKNHEVTLPQKIDAKFWLSVGDKETATNLTHAPSNMFQEISQIDGVELAVKKLSAIGANVKYSVHPGTHSAEPWKQELAPALEWLVGKR